MPSAVFICLKIDDQHYHDIKKRSNEPFQAKTPLIATDCFLRHKGKRDVIIFFMFNTVRG